MMTIHAILTGLRLIYNVHQWYSGNISVARLLIAKMFIPASTSLSLHCNKTKKEFQNRKQRVERRSHAEVKMPTYRCLCIPW